MKGAAIWNSFRTDDRLGGSAKVISYPAGSGDEIHAYFAGPAIEEPVPAVVAGHHMPGWDKFYGSPQSGSPARCAE
jgi:carboxymethylenebutenolidase